MSRLKKQWEDEHTEWRKRDLSDRRYVYWWADGVYSNVRMDDRLCLLVIIGVTEQGRRSWWPSRTASASRRTAGRPC
ncbi:hypothetical protein HSBAA_45350 [Vreelandella sulfidaeris]|uniref:Mutator family transposase n=1 Tax=Vreelandella sulfidaeris TaxID=115553 RepID=A0A455UG89_9GAMM|nr:hypothetical protein HSBAA_45350 [Halomonas sulfidaeris]